MKQRRLFKLSLLALSIYSHFSVATELNLDFIQGTSVIPSILKTDTALPAGQYVVDVLVNNERTGRANLVITEADEKNNSLCLSPEWLDNAGVMMKQDAYDEAFDKEEQCYVLTRNPHTKVAFDYGAQTLKFNIPQAYLLSKTDPARWDYGVNGGRLKYYGNFNKTVHNDMNAFGNLDATINLGRWVLSSNMNVSHVRDKTEFTSSDLTLSTAISQVQGDLFLGKSQTRTELFSDFNFYGAALRSNSNMRPWESRGYALDISGVAPTPSRITVKQNGYTVYSKMVPAGPYRLDDLRPMGNGDLVVIVEDESGNKTEQVYQSKGYVEFAEFNPKDIWRYGNQKSRYEARLSHRFDGTYLSGSYWRQDYWMRDGHDTGSTLSFSTSVFDSMSLFLNGSYSKYAWSDKADYSVSLSVSVPFDLKGPRHYSSNSVGYTRTGGTTFNTSMSAMPTDRFNYSLSANAGSKGDRGASASASYAFDAIQTNMGVSRSYNRHGNSQTSFSGSVSGSVLGTSETGPLFTKESSDTVGIVSIPGVEGVSVNSSMPTNSDGNTVVWLSEYSENSININMDNVPDDMEFETTSYNVVPTEKAMVYRKFGFENVLRYILRVKDAQGNYLTGGDANTEQGLNAGFISNNGVLLMNMLAEPKTVSVNTGDGKQCRFSMAGLKANTNKVQEVRCE
ncbi:TPA: fimbria/pilus outer membrane usher protein [Escherichia coli]|nr:fimbria/pilus outer membrane usher protein [Escherichia coli]HCN8347949.1 fimbria/pilus outer membrane usher protein [Escherichia coli]HCN9034888.1 fimbria/pilus outer membrane usher protein [Escherichia coli]